MYIRLISVKLALIVYEVLICFVYCDIYQVIAFLLDIIEKDVIYVPLKHFLVWFLSATKR